jgi:quercetin dioxygenase-like cupin family protein
VSVPFVVRAATRQRVAWIGGSVHRVLVDGAATEGRIALLRSSMRGGTASPVHVHEREDETVFMLDGEATFWAGPLRWDLRSGDTAFLPRGVPHTYAITSEAADLITVCNPAGVEQFFRAAGWTSSDPPPQDWSPNVELMRLAAEACGQRVLGPPIAVGDTMPDAYLPPGVDAVHDPILFEVGQCTGDRDEGTARRA